MGIHKQGDKIRPINYGTFIGIILDKLQNYELKDSKEKFEEHEFHFSNIKEMDKIVNKEKIQNILLLDEKYVSSKEKILIVKSRSHIYIYFLESKNLKFKIQLRNEKLEDDDDEDDDVYNYDSRYDILDKLEIVDEKYYKELPLNSFLLITKKYKIEINLDKNKGKIVGTIYDYFDSYKSENSLINIASHIIKHGEYISNLDVFSQGMLENEEDGNYIYFFNQKFHLEKKIEKRINGRTFELCGKYFIHYFYMRGGSTTSVYDINNNYQEIYSKTFYHQGNLSFIDNNKYLILPPSPDDYDNDCYKYTFVNLENFSDRLIDVRELCGNYNDEPMIIHKFKGQKYLQCVSPGFWCGKIQNSNWSIIEEKEGKFILKEKAMEDCVLGDNLLFLKNNVIISWHFNGYHIHFLNY